VAEQLSAVPSAPVGPSPPERRASARRPCPGAVLVEFLVKPTFSRGRGQLRDLSAEGLGLLLLHRLDLGVVLFVRLPGLRPGSSVTQMARVMHTTRLPDGSWLVGCKLTHRLSEVQLRAVLTGG
jgi:PilZ domain